ncbi:MAG: hypothetical protein PF447_02060, partial [Spirochaetaceae bacterium]|nr:hypothetical protein [Spirochaetaceae bacterium]
MKKTNQTFSSLFFLQMSLALMFIALGILGLTNYNSEFAQFGRSVNRMFGSNSNVLPVIFAVVELIAGGLLLLSSFSRIPGNILSISLLIIFIFWAVNILMNYFLEGLFEPNFAVWLG